MPKYAYQKTLYVNNDMEFDKGEFSSYNKSDMKEACRVIGGGAGFILWTIFAGNANMFEVDISSAWVSKNYGISKNTYRNGLDDLRKFGYIIDHQYDNYGVEFYCRTVVGSEWLMLVPKTRTGKYSDELKKEYRELVDSGLVYPKYTLEQQWLYQLGDMNNW